MWKKTRNKKDSREKLGLDHNYKHVVIIGLFTERKNQKYAFQLANQLSNYKIKFHFLGNQASNFSSYWKPLMDWKESNSNLDNCIIHGETSNTEEFIKASDLFLFPSMTNVLRSFTFKYNIPTWALIYNGLIK